MRGKVTDDASGPAIVWFRNDLRLADNPALTAAANRKLIAIYILDDETPGLRRMGGASRWWLHGSLEALKEGLTAQGADLHIFQGPAEAILLDLVEGSGATSVYWNRRYDEPERRQDEGIKARLKAEGIEAKSHNAHLLYEPWEVVGKSGGPMKVFTPFWRAARATHAPAPPLPAPEKLSGAAMPKNLKRQPVSLDSLGLKPTRPNWAAEMENVWTPGETGAQAALSDFLDSKAKGYGDRRNRPDIEGTSRLSPYLRFGEIGPRQVWSAARHGVESGDIAASETDIDKFLSEIGWREFSHHLLYQFPDLAKKNFQPKFDGFPWRDDPAALEAWKRGTTGYPIVDAGMRQLWRTGWMHNRVRMIVASFLVKHLLLDWRTGEEWFWDTLVDACPANNTASWQWVAGSGADAAPYFRVFAPVLQGEKFDPKGDYVREFVPEISKLPATYIHKPWESPHPILARAGITLGETYPFPIVRHDEGRDRALAAFKSLSSESS